MQKRQHLFWLLIVALIPVVAEAQTTRPASRPAAQKISATQPVLRDALRHKAILAQSKAKKFDVIFLGDSITQGFDAEIWKREFEPLGAGNFGSSGDSTQHLLWRITEGGELDGQAPRVVVILIGANNLRNTADEITEAITLIVQTVRQKLPDSKILLHGIFPRELEPKDRTRARLKFVNTALARLDDGKTIRVVNLWEKFLDADEQFLPEVMDDTVHLAPKRYEIWAENMKPVLVGMLGAN